MYLKMYHNFHTNFCHKNIIVYALIRSYDFHKKVLLILEKWFHYKSSELIPYIFVCTNTRIRNEKGGEGGGGGGGDRTTTTDQLIYGSH